jgi:hypothetical protein
VAYKCKRALTNGTKQSRDAGNNKARDARVQTALKVMWNCASPWIVRMQSVKEMLPDLASQADQLNKQLLPHS